MSLTVPLLVLALAAPPDGPEVAPPPRPVPLTADQQVRPPSGTEAAGKHPVRPTEGVRAADDVAAPPAPAGGPFWTPRRAVAAALVLAIGCVLVLLWVVILRHRVS